MPDLRHLPAAASRKGWPWTFDAMPPATNDESTTWPRITVVTPSFNQGRFIEETIRSVLLQGYPNLEYIVVDGGSADTTLDILKKYEPCLAFWVSEKDRGQSHAINKGFARATGDIFSWLCSDDVLAPGALRKVADAVSDRKLTMVIGDSVITYGPESLEGRLDRRRPDFRDMAYDVKTLAQPSVFWTADLWQAAGPLDENLYFLMDYDLWLSMVPKAKHVVYVDSVLSYQRTQPSQKTNPNHPGSNKYLNLRAEVAYRAARARGESSLGWVTRVWWHRLAREKLRIWRLRDSGFHWQALRRAWQK